jgi:hypothetical protein
MKTKKKNLVHYCPGDAPGSPAWMPREQAEKELEKDLAFLEKMKQAGMEVKVWSYIEMHVK